MNSLKDCVTIHLRLIKKDVLGFFHLFNLYLTLAVENIYTIDLQKQYVYIAIHYIYTLP